MASCAYCHSMILFGGVTAGELRFCNQNCHEQGRFIRKAERIPDRDVAPALRRVHCGACPECEGSGPVDVHYSHTVLSLIVMTSWNSKPKVCCRKCGRSTQIGALVQCFFLGWWGFPWGLIMTPVQICKNISAMVGGPKPDEPSEELERLVRLMIADGTIRVRSAEVADDDNEDEFIEDAFEDDGAVDAEVDDEYDDVEVVSRSSTSKASPNVRKPAVAAPPDSPQDEPKTAPKPARSTETASTSAPSGSADRVSCGGCGASFKAPPAVRGKRVKCPKCATIIDVPE